jgi:hypothetical protein
VSSFISVRNGAVFASFSALCLLAWFWMVPAVLSGSTFASVVVFLMGATAVSLTTWRNAQATGSTAQILHTTEAAAPNVEAERKW